MIAPPAHPAQRPPFIDPTRDAYDDASDRIVEILTAGVREIDLAGAAVVEGLFVEGRVILRLVSVAAAGGPAGPTGDAREMRKAWAMPTIEASLLALRLRLAPDVVANHKIADALNAAVRIAERKVAAVHDWSARVRPTEDVE